ncbi:MAG: hypothetical protein JSU87_02805 [Gemmatimonadota bacterium]|nr:MAG: hypothetical protein JSU87_02805 [Gemmatimonadota bacterium]
MHKKDGRANGSRRRMLQKGVNGSSNADRALPLDLRLRAIAENVPASSVEEVWVFPPLPDRSIASEFIVLVCYNGGDDRRRILTCHVDAQLGESEGDELRWVQRVREQGTAPHSWVTGMPDRLLKRLSDAGVPEIVEIGGRSQAWEEAVARFAGGAAEGAASGLAGGVPNVDIRVQPEISFSTVIELPSNGATPEHT